MEAWCRIFPAQLQQRLQMGQEILAYQTEEIRLRVGQPLLMSGAGRAIIWQGTTWLDRPPVTKRTTGNDRTDLKRDTPDADFEGGLTAADLQQIFNQACQGSYYALEEELKNGYVTLPGGHRLGFCGRAVVDGSQICSMKDIRFMNLRIAHQIMGNTEDILPWLTSQGRWLSVLIISPPLGGKTTLLRELVRLASTGVSSQLIKGQALEGVSVSLVDERSELAGCYMGKPQFELGPLTDVLDGCPKAQGMMLMIRSMAPRILAVDEIGSSADLRALRQALACGIVVFATVHGLDHRELQNRPGLQCLIKEGLFQRILVMKGHAGQRRPPEIYEGSTLQRLV